MFLFLVYLQCELDIMFHLEKAHFMLEEMVMNGCLVETSKSNILTPIQLMDKTSWSRKIRMSSDFCIIIDSPCHYSVYNINVNISICFSFLSLPSCMNDFVPIRKTINLEEHCLEFISHVYVSCILTAILFIRAPELISIVHYWTFVQ